MADLTVSNDIDNFMQSADSAAARNSLGLGNVDNTADANKPVSTAQQSALNNKQDILTEGAFENGDKTKLDNQSGVNTGDESTATETTEGIVKASDFGKSLIAQPSKRFAQDLLSVPLPFAAFNLIEDQDIWRKAAKFTSTKDTAITVDVKSSTGYCRIMNHDGTLEAVDGTGAAGSKISVASKAPPSDRAPRFYAIYPCDASGNLSGDLNWLQLDDNKLTSFDGTGLSSLTVLTISSNQLTSFDGTGLSALTSLYLNSNQLTSFDGTGLSALTSLFLNSNQLTSFDGTGLSAVANLNLSNNQLTSFDGTGLSAVTDLNLSNNQLTSFDGTGLSAVTDLTLGGNQLTSFVVGDLELEDRYSYYTCLELRNQQLDAAAIQTIYDDLPDGTSYGSYSNTIDVGGNPGAGTGSGTDPSVATAKGWTVVGDVA